MQMELRENTEKEKYHSKVIIVYYYIGKLMTIQSMQIMHINLLGNKCKAA